MLPLGPSSAALLVLGLSVFSPANAYELYNNVLPTEVHTAADGTYTGLPAYDPHRIPVPALPVPENIPKEVTLDIASSPAGAPFPASKPQKGNFLGFSIELSVAMSVMGHSGELLEPTFLNYMANIRNRAKMGPLIRVGGNSQDGSTLKLEGLKNPTEKYKSDLDTPTSTPIINYSDSLFEVMANISSLIDAEWYFGLAFNQSTVENKSTNVGLAVGHATNILGRHLKGLSMGNEPDLFLDHHKRRQDYTVMDYFGEFLEFRDFVQEESGLSSPMQLTGPAVCCDRPNFYIYDVFNTGWLEANLEYLSTVTVQHYPANNCQNPKYPPPAPEEIFHQFLTHEQAKVNTVNYIAAANTVNEHGKEFVMMEFNTASCGGFPGLSDSFAGTMWIMDWTLQMAWGNFTAAMMHVGGQNVYYNPFTPPPWTLPNAGWTTGAVYYSALVVSEIIGSTNTSQVVDFFHEDNGTNPAYLIYENGAPARVALFNYLSDENGAADYTATINVQGMNLDHVNVRYLIAPTISDQWNITWAGQSMGKAFEADGRLRGEVQTERIECTDGKCAVKVPAPSVTVVFFTDDALEDSTPPDDATEFQTTMIDGGRGLAFDKSLIDKGNGMNPDWNLVYGQAPPSSFDKFEADSASRVAPGTLAAGILALSLFMAW